MRDNIHTSSSILMGNRTSKCIRHTYQWAPTPDPLSVYVPFESITKRLIQSIVSVVQRVDRHNHNNSQRPLFAFLLVLNEQLENIEKTSHINAHAAHVRQWLVDIENRPLNWDQLRTHYKQMLQHERANTQSDVRQPYWELTVKIVSKSVSLC
jgi:hypothetical protein